MDELEQFVAGKTDYCPFDCHRKKSKWLFCTKRYFKVIDKYCEVFHMTEEERRVFFEEGKRKLGMTMGKEMLSVIDE